MGLVEGAVEALAVAVALYYAYDIRLAAVNTYGKVIHEFDPWFNYRATEYLTEHGYQKFSTWYDDQVWWPLGRPVGTTTYPGMMVTASGIFKFLNEQGFKVSLNDVCVMLPAYFGAVSTLFTYGIAREVTRDAGASVATAFIMAVLPAHLMRSVAGGFDNECVAIPAICGTFYLWLRALRTSDETDNTIVGWSWTLGAAAGAMHAFLAATWGGYVFVINMVGIHAVVLLLNHVRAGTFSERLYRAYTLFYVVGTTLALQVQIVGWAPIRSLEQFGPLAAFFLFQAWKAYHAAGLRLSVEQLLGGIAIAGTAVVTALMQSGHLWAMSARVQALFIRHTRTGNPLVDSVAEHRSTPFGAYMHYFHITLYFGLFGFLACLEQPRTEGKIFVSLYCFLTAYFSGKMIRLIVLLAPAIAVVAGFGLKTTFVWSYRRAKVHVAELMGEAERRENGAAPGSEAGARAKQDQDAAKQDATPAPPPADEQKAASKTAKAAAKALARGDTPPESERGQAQIPDVDFIEECKQLIEDEVRPHKNHISLVLLMVCVFGALQFWKHSFTMAHHLSEPQVIIRNKQGEILDDFREAYWHLRDNTPEDSRVLAWWDYGYQINGIAKRTTIADGNTWNHEHIALLGRALVSNEEESYKITRHLADYVLVWSTKHAGLWGDDMAKMPHMARIAGSVFEDIDPSEYSFMKGNKPSPRMTDSLLYQIHSYGIEGADPQVPELTHYQEFYTTKNKMVRIFKVLNVSQESKSHPIGSYPEALREFMDEMVPFGSR